MPQETKQNPEVIFLHTADLHCATFDRLMREEAPHLAFDAWVDAALLRRATEQGGVAAEIEQDLKDWLQRAAATGAQVIVCSCSTLGGAAEALGQDLGLKVLRIDRGMAEAAVAAGPRILVLAALETTLGPTRELLEEVAAAAGGEVTITLKVVEDAWKAFLAGDQSAYLSQIAQCLRAHDGSADVIVLAQASMADAITAAGKLDSKVLSSPRLGLRRALAELPPQRQR